MTKPQRVPEEIDLTQAIRKESVATRPRSHGREEEEEFELRQREKDARRGWREERERKRSARDGFRRR